MSARESGGALKPGPLWFRAARAAIRQLPLGRFRAFHWLLKVPLRPFEDRLGDDAGRMVYRCDLRYVASREMCLTGRYAPHETALLRALLKPGDTLVDVGANLGYFSLVGAAAVGAGGRVVALEPDPRMAAELEENVRRNGLDHVHTVRAAAFDRRGTATLAGYDEAAGNWGVSTLQSAPASPTTFTVECAPLDDLLDDLGIDGVSLVKIDVEGAEQAVLRGMRAGLARGRYRRVMVELHPWTYEDRNAAVREMVEQMEGFGFRGVLADSSPAAVRSALYGRGRLPPMVPFAADTPVEGWPHVLWTLPGSEPS